MRRREMHSLAHSKQFTLFYSHFMSFVPHKYSFKLYNLYILICKSFEAIKKMANHNNFTRTQAHIFCWVNSKQSREREKKSNKNAFENDLHLAKLIKSFRFYLLVRKKVQQFKSCVFFFHFVWFRTEICFDFVICSEQKTKKIEENCCWLSPERVCVNLFSGESWSKRDANCISVNLFDRQLQSNVIENGNVSSSLPPPSLFCSSTNVSKLLELSDKWNRV